MVNQPTRPWYREVDRDQWRAFAATFVTWLLDAFDFTILTFILIDIQQSFTVDRALAGALGTVTLMFRLVGGLGAGMLADRYGRKLPLMLSVLWFSLFAFLSGFSTSYAMLFAFRALFGIGMGGPWAAGMPLALEHWPARLRGLASGLLQGGWFWGYMLAALTFHYTYPLFSSLPDPLSDAEGSTLGWRVMFWVGIVPALLVPWIRSGVKESPVWLARRQHLQETGTDGAAERMSILQLLRPDLLWATVQSSILMGAFMFSYYSLSFWYPTFLREAGREPLGYLLAFNLGAVVGNGALGARVRNAARPAGRGWRRRLSSAWRRSPPTSGGPAPSCYCSAPSSWAPRGAGVWGMAPSYLLERFPTAVRGVGPGLSYHVGAALGALTPLVLGRLQDGGMSTGSAMMACIAVSGLLVAAVVWLGPETRGRRFAATET